MYLRRTWVGLLVKDSVRSKRQNDPIPKGTCRPFWRCRFTTLVGIIPYCFAGWSVCKLNVLINEDCSVHICEACGSISVFFDVKNRWKLDMFLFCWLSTLVFLCLFPDVKIPDVLDLCADCKIVKFSKWWDLIATDIEILILQIKNGLKLVYATIWQFIKVQCLLNQCQMLCS